MRLVGRIICAIHDDVSVARQEAALQLAWSVGTFDHAAAMQAAGFGDEASAICEAFGRGDHEAMRVAVTDDMLDEMTAWGRAEDVRDRLRRVEHRFDHIVVEPPHWSLASERVRENTLAVLETFGPFRTSPLRWPLGGLGRGAYTWART